MSSLRSFICLTQAPLRRRNCFAFRLDDPLIGEFVKMNHRAAFAEGLICSAGSPSGSAGGAIDWAFESELFPENPGQFNVVSKPLFWAKI